MSPANTKSNAIHQLFAYLCVGDVNKAIQFYTEVFGGQERLRLTEPSGRIGHAEVELAPGIVVMMSDPFPECGINPPAPGAGTSVTLHLHADNADDIIERALKAGATLERPAKDEFYGERSGVFRDPFGHRWNIGHSIERVSGEEMQARYTALLSAK